MNYGEARYELPGDSLPILLLDCSWLFCLWLCKLVCHLRNSGYFKNLGDPWIRPRSLFSQILKGLLFAWTLWIYLPSLKFVALTVPEIIWGTQKIGAVPGYAHAPFSPKILKGFCSNISAKFEVHSFIRSWDNGGTEKIWAVPVYAHAPFSPKFLISFCSHRPSEYICLIFRS